MTKRSRDPPRSTRPHARSVRAKFYSVAHFLIAGALLGATAFAQTGPPPVQITKTPGAQDVVEGCEAFFDIRVFSPSDECRNLSDVDVADPTTPDCERMDQALVCEGPDLSYSCVTGPLTASFDNVATVTALVDDEVPFTATASSTAAVTVVPTGVEITKLPATRETLDARGA